MHAETTYAGMTHYLRSDRLPLRLALGYVAFAVAIMLAVDLWLRITEGGTPVWFLLFREGGPSEHLSWYLLGAAALLASGTSARSSGDEAAAWRWFSVALVLLLIEDAGNTSHRFAAYLNIAASQAGMPELSLNVGRLAIYTLLGCFLLLVLWRFRNVWLTHATIGRVLLAGYVAYGVAAFLSVPFNLFSEGYQPVGDALLTGVFGGRLVGLAEPIWGATSDNTGAVFMDLVIEESIEVIAAGLLATASLRGWRWSQYQAVSDPATATVVTD